MRSSRYLNKLPIPVLVASQFAVAAGESGRMPLAQNSKGRDYNKRVGSLRIAGGGFKGGYIHGETDPLGYTVSVIASACLTCARRYFTSLVLMIDACFISMLDATKARRMMWSLVPAFIPSWSTLC